MLQNLALRRTVGRDILKHRRWFGGGSTLLNRKRGKPASIQQNMERQVGSGSNSEVGGRNREVRCAPVNGHRQADLACPESASNGTSDGLAVPNSLCAISIASF